MSFAPNRLHSEDTRLTRRAMENEGRLTVMSADDRKEGFHLEFIQLHCRVSLTRQTWQASFLGQHVLIERWLKVFSIIDKSQFKRRNQNYRNGRLRRDEFYDPSLVEFPHCALTRLVDERRGHEANLVDLIEIDNGFVNRDENDDTFRIVDAEQSNLYAYHKF